MFGMGDGCAGPGSGEKAHSRESSRENPAERPCAFLFYFLGRTRLTVVSSDGLGTHIIYLEGAYKLS